MSLPTEITAVGAPASRAPSPMPAAPVSNSPSFLQSVFSPPAAEAPAPAAEPVATPVTAPAETTPAAPETTAEEKAAASSKKGMDALLDKVEEKAATDEQDDEYGELDENAKPEAKYKWGELRAKAKAHDKLQKKIEAMEAELKNRSNLQEADPLKARIKELEERDNQREQEAAMWRIEKTQTWKSEVDAPWQNLAAHCQSMAGRNEGLQAEAVWNVLQESNPKRQNEMIAELQDTLSPVDYSRLAGMAVKAQEVMAKEAELRQNAATALKDYTERENREKTEKATLTKASEKRAVSETVEKMKAISGLLTTEGGESSDAVMAAILAEANETPFDELSVDDRAFALASAAALPRMKKSYDAAVKKIEALKREIAGLAGATPSPAEGTRQPDAGKPDPNLNFLQAIGMGR